MKKRILPILLTLIFLFLGIATLGDYGISWDEPIHFIRGQAYLNFFLTGKKNYQNIGIDNRKLTRRSIYQDDNWTVERWLKEDSGHPPIGDILASFTNYIFYQKLGILPDIESYHLLIVFLSSILVFLIFEFTCNNYSRFAALIAALSLCLYPLFLGESHFNIKDPVETFFFTLMILSFYQGVKKSKWQWILVSAIAFGFALGTKFNILFALFIIGPWLIIKFLEKKKLKLAPSVIRALIIYPLVALLIFFISWPYLWHHPFANLSSIIKYYKGIGYQITYQPSKYLTSRGFNTYAFQWILYTTPLITMFFTFWGLVYSLKNWPKEKDKTSLLILFWFLLPILRVSLPKMGIYGGVRQIMEYIPAMAILSGIGANQLRRFVLNRFPQLKKYNCLVVGGFLLLFFPLTLKLISIHPNENVYFNVLIGGLRGAKEKKLYEWGNSFGNVYRQGVKWINQNAPPQAKLVLAMGYEVNLPKIWVRNDVDYSNDFRSGIKSQGEYAIEMTHDLQISTYYFDYLNRFLKPVWEVKIDGVPILKIWKNDWEYRYPEYQKKEELVEIKQFQQEEEYIGVNLEKEIVLTGFEVISFEQKCYFKGGEYFSTSFDGEVWMNYPTIEGEKDFFPKIYFPQQGNKLFYFFAGEKVKFINLIRDKNDPCYRNIKIFIKKLAD